MKELSFDLARLLLMSFQIYLHEVARYFVVNKNIIKKGDLELSVNVGEIKFFDCTQNILNICWIKINNLVYTDTHLSWNLTAAIADGIAMRGIHNV